MNSLSTSALSTQPNGVRSQNNGISPDDVAQVLESARGRTVVVVGDVMLDEWIIGHAGRISPEAPVPVLKWSERRTAPGGAANVAMNLLRLGARVAIYGVVGEDESGRDLARVLCEAGADVDGLVQDSSRPTTLKTRIVAQRQQVVRIDRESDAPISQIIKKELQARLQNAWQDASALCLSDYDKGLAACSAFQDAAESARQCATSSTRTAGASTTFRITGGPKPHNLGCFANADFLSLNQQEASEASGLKLDTKETVEAAGEKLRQKIGVQTLVITRGGKGVALFQESGTSHIGAHEVEVFDVAGAGDTFLAAATIALAGGADFQIAAEIGNLAAAASVRHAGVVAVELEEILRIAGER